MSLTRFSSLAAALLLCACSSQDAGLPARDTADVQDTATEGDAETGSIDLESSKPPPSTFNWSAGTDQVPGIVFHREEVDVTKAAVLQLAIPQTLKEIFVDATAMDGEFLFLCGSDASKVSVADANGDVFEMVPMFENNNSIWGTASGKVIDAATTVRVEFTPFSFGSLDASETCQVDLVGPNQGPVEPEPEPVPEPPIANCGGLAGFSCNEGQFCDFDPADICGGADQLGTCRTRPDVCILLFAPVCGCDGNTYGNSCQAASAGVSVFENGPCEVVGAPDDDIIGRFNESRNRRASTRGEAVEEFKPVPNRFDDRLGEGNFGRLRGQ